GVAAELAPGADRTRVIEQTLPSQGTCDQDRREPCSSCSTRPSLNCTHRKAPGGCPARLPAGGARAHQYGIQIAGVAVTVAVAGVQDPGLPPEIGSDGSIRQKNCTA